MGLSELLSSLFGKRPQSKASPPLPPPDQVKTVGELIRWLQVDEGQLRIQPRYQRFTIPKRSGGRREILAPEAALKELQRRIATRLLAGLHAHPAAIGFERGQSIVTHALLHAHRAVVLRLDIQDFFPSIQASAVEQYFRRTGWNQEAARLLTNVCTFEGHLPQGAPTSPRLSNLVNYRLDARLSGLANRKSWDTQNPKTLARVRRDPHATPVEVAYSRYADDLTFSFSVEDHAVVNTVLWHAKQVVEDEGYRLHTKKKLRIMRRHNRQAVTGLVVNEGVQLPRETRRWLRAVEHRIATGDEATLTEAQLQGWRSLQSMIAKQSGAA